MAQIAGIVLALAGAYEKRRGFQKQERAEKEALELQKHYDKQAIRTLGDEKIFGASEWMFPGLLAPPLRNAKNQSIFGEGKGISKGAGKNASSTRDPWGYLREQGMPQGGGVSSSTAPTHGGIDPTAPPITETSGSMGSLTSSTGTSVNPLDQPYGNDTFREDVAAPHKPVGGDYDTPETQHGRPEGRLVKKYSHSGPGSNLVDWADRTFGGGRRGSQEAARLEEAHHSNVIKKKKRLGLGKFGRRQAAREEGAVTGTTPAGDYPGQLIMEHLTNLLKNPGQLSSTTYERDQEQANQGLNAALAMNTGQLTGLGMAPRSGVGQIGMENAILNFGKERNEAARDYSLAQEELRRQDIQAGIQDYLSFLQTVFGLQQARADVKSKRKAGQRTKAGNENIEGGQMLRDAGHSLMGAGGGMGGSSMGGMTGGMGGAGGGATSGAGVMGTGGV